MQLQRGGCTTYNTQNLQGLDGPWATQLQGAIVAKKGWIYDAPETQAFYCTMRVNVTNLLALVQ